MRGVAKKLFTPGPLGVSLTTKQAMLLDVGSRDTFFLQVIKDIREKLLVLAKLPAQEYVTVPMQGSGTFALESALGSSLPREGGHFLLFENGSYGQRLAKLSKDTLGVRTTVISTPEDQQLDLNGARHVLETFARGDQGPKVTHVGVVHCETSSGVINDVEALGPLVKDILGGDTAYFIDAMSSFGGIETDYGASKADLVVSSVNKCLEGVPGFSYILCRRNHLETLRGRSRSLSLDLFDQYKALDANGQFRFTPATHSMVALAQALRELDLEGGVEARAKRYQNNHRVLSEGMRALGFKSLLNFKDHPKAYIINSYYYPKHHHFSFSPFYQKLNERGFVIYPGKVTVADCFRVGCIGHLFEKDFVELLEAMKEVLHEMQIPLPIPQ